MSHQLNRIKQAGLQYVSELQLPVIPLCSHDHRGVTDLHAEKCKSPGKVPTIAQWSDKTNTTKRDIKSWLIDNPHMNLGLILGKTDNYNLIGIDIDGSKGLEYWFKLTTEHGQHESTWEFTTPGGGTRLLFTAPTDFKSKKHATPLDGEHQEVAFIAQGQQTVLPPSVHANGGTYEWVDNCCPDSIPKPAPCPQWILDLVNDDGSSTDKKNGSKKVSKFDTQMATITKARTNTMGEFIGSFVRRNFEIMSLDDCIDSCKNWMYSNIEYKDEEQYFLDQVVLMTTRFYESEVKKATSGLSKEEEKIMLSDASLSQFCIEKFADEGYHLRFDKSRNQLAVSSSTRGPWRFMYPDELKTFVTRCIQEEYGNKVVKVNKIKNILDLMCIFLDDNTLIDKTNTFDSYLKSDDSIVVENGVLDIKSGKLEHWNPKKHYHINSIEAKWREPDLELLEEWDNILTKWIPDFETRLFLQEYIGYALTPSCDLTAWTFLAGKGSNGKSIFIEIIVSLFGGSKALVELDRLSDRFGAAGLEDKLLYYNPDIEAEYIQKPGKLKRMIDSENIVVEKKNQDTFEIKPYGKFLLAANTLPETSDKTDGWLRRLRIVNFPNKFTQDPDFKNKTVSTFTSPKGKSVILAWAVEGLRRVLDNGRFTSSSEMEISIENYKKQNDVVVEFLFDELTTIVRVEKEPMYLCSTPLNKLFDYFTSWITHNGNKALSKQTFKRRLELCGCEFKKVRTPSGSTSLSLIGYRINNHTDYANSIGGNYNVSFGEK